MRTCPSLSIAVASTIVLALQVSVLAADGPGGHSVNGRVSVPPGSEARPGDAVVYIDAALGAPPVSTTTIEMKGEAFSPRVVALSRGSTVVFHNGDEVAHSPYSSSSGNRFELGVVKPGATAAARLDAPGVVEVRCLVHPGMVGYVVAAPSRYVARADEGGNYRIEGLPAGRYKLRAWHPGLDPAESWVNLDDAERRTIDLRLKR